MEYNDRYYSNFNLEYNPFIKNNQDKFTFESKEHIEVKYKLDYLFNTKGIGIITGNPGIGKTTIVREYVNKLNKALYKVIYVSMTTLCENELYKLLIKEFGYEPAFRKGDNYLILQNIINDYNLKHITPVIIIDEANYLSRGMLNDIKMIFNFNMDSIDSYILLLIGLPVLAGTLQSNLHEPLRQRIIFEYKMGGLEGDEIRNYIYSKIEKAGGTSSIIKDGVLQPVINYSKGTLRTIDRIMDYSLLIADKLKSNVITPDIIEKAISQIR